MLTVNAPKFAAVEKPEVDINQQDNSQLALVASFSETIADQPTENIIVTNLEEKRDLTLQVNKLRLKLLEQELKSESSQEK
jgi:hypothetical protein